MQATTRATRRARWIAGREGDWIVRPDLAGALKRLARSGPAAFYRDDLAQEMLQTVTPVCSACYLMSWILENSSWIG